MAEKIAKEKGTLDMLELEAVVTQDERKKARQVKQIENKKASSQNMVDNQATEIARLATRSRWNVKEKEKYLPLVESFLRDECADEVCNQHCIVIILASSQSSSLSGWQTASPLLSHSAM